MGVTVRRRRAQTTKVATLVALVAMLFALPALAPPEGVPVDDADSILAAQSQPPGTAHAGVPEWVREENLRAEVQMARQAEAKVMVDLVRAENPERVRDLLRGLDACEAGMEGGWGTADCGLAQERAMEAGRELMQGNSREFPRP